MADIHFSHTVMLTMLLVLACAMPTMPGAQEVQQQRASLVVQFSDERYVTYCVSLGPGRTSGLDLLRQAGLEVATWGTAVCRIEGTGCDYPGERCFCQCLAAPCRFWSYWQWHGGRWVYSQIGAGQHQVSDGDAEAWVWGDGQTPPVVTPADLVCPPGDSPPAVQAGPGVTLDQPQLPSGGAPLDSGGPRDRASGRGVPYREYALFTAISGALLTGFFRLRLRHQGR